MEKQNYTHLFADGEYTREQLADILQAGGFNVNDDTFRNLEMKENGKYEGETFRIMWGDASLVGLSKKDAGDSLFEGKFQRLADVLGQRYLSDIEVTDCNPMTMESRNGIAFVKARIAGVPMDYREFGGSLFNSYVQGIKTEKDIAASIYYPDMLRMHEELCRKALRNKTTQALTEAARSDKGSMQIVYIHPPVHKDQLRAIIGKCGFQTTPDTFRNLVKDESGQYRGVSFMVEDGKATVLSKAEADEYRFHPERKDLYEVLGPKVITEAAVTLAHPESGKPAKQGHGFLTCKLFGMETSPMPIGKSLMHLYEKGHTTPQKMAAAIYRDEMVGHFQTVVIPVTVGHRMSNGSQTRYYGDYTADGYMYKDLTALDEKDGVCLISESNLRDYEEDLNEGRMMDIDEYADSYGELVAYARDLALRNPEKIVRHAVETSTWQSAFALLEEFYNYCETEDILSLDEEVQDKFDRYVDEHGQQPNYAEVFIEYKDDQASLRDMIALNPEAGEQADDEVVFTCSSFDDFKRLTAEDNGEDFVIREIYAYHAGSMDGQKRTFDDAHIHDELAETIRQAMQAEERVIEVDMDMTPCQLKDVLAKEGIAVPEILPGTEEPLPLNKDNGNVASVYIRVVDGTVIDWADDYMYRDAKSKGIGTDITKLSHIAVSQEQMALELAQLENENDKLLHITDVRVYRNTQNAASTEFRMRCKIDGQQQMGKVLTAAQVEKLANGEDKTRMAAEVFARELTLNNPQSQQKALTR